MTLSTGTGDVLVGIRDWLRDKLSLDTDPGNVPPQCDVMVGDDPPATSGAMFVGIEGSAINVGSDDSYHLSEEWSVTISIWQRREDQVADTMGLYEMALAPDAASSADTLSTLTGKVLGALHQRYDMMAWLSARLDATNADCRYTLPLSTSSVNATDRILTPADEGPEWVQRTISLSGLTRIVPIEI